MATTITTLLQLQAMENDLAEDYELGDDIDASTTSGWNGGLGFDPVGGITTPFEGSFDGKGYTISDLFINRPTTSNVGLFGWTGVSFFAPEVTGCGEIKGVGLLNCDITGLSGGSLIGTQGSGCDPVSDCYATGSVTVDHDDDPQSDISGIGGLIGEATSDITDCYSTCSVAGTLTSSRSHAMIRSIGGLVGDYTTGTVTGCYATGSVTVVCSKRSRYVGGLAGYSSGTIATSYATGNISVTTNDSWLNYIGGFVGLCNGGSISNCYAHSGVTVVAGSTTYGITGGFVGGGGTHDDCYSTGSISATEGLNYVGGFSGVSGSFTNCFWDTATSGYATSGGGTGKTTAQMKREATFTDAGWDFDTIWQIDSVANNGYPALTDVGTAPTVTTQAVSVIAAETATGNGNITTLGDPSPIAHGVCYNTTGSPTVADSATDEGAAVATGAFTSSMTGLSINTKYYVKAYASNAEGTGYGDEVNFTTLGVPTIVTQTCESVVGATATGRGNITVIGNPTPTAHGHCWHTSADPTPSNSFVDNGAASVVGAFISSITGLTPGTAYYTRAYATNTQGTVYGANVYFVPPTTGTTGRAGYTWDESSNLRTFDENAIEQELLNKSDVDDTPENGATDVPPSSNWAYDHENDPDAHGEPTITTDSGTVTADDLAFSIVGGEGIDTSGATTVVTIAGEDATDTNKGIASFDAQHFTVTSGAVDLNIDDTPVDGETDEPITSNWAYDHVAAADPHTGYPLKSLFDAANTILKADVQSTPEGLTVAEQRLVGRITGGEIAALTGAQVMALLSGQAGAAFSLNAQDLSYVGHIGLGNNAASANYGILYDETLPAITDNAVRSGILGGIGAFKTSAAYTGVLTAGDFIATVDFGNTQNWTDAIGVRGVWGSILIETGTAAPSTITGVASLYADIAVGEAANDMVLINYYGLYVAANSLIANSKLTNDYGIYIGNQAGGAALNYAIYTNAGLVRFGDAVTLASTLALGGDVAGGGYDLDNIGHIGLGNQVASPHIGLDYYEKVEITTSVKYGLYAVLDVYRLDTAWTAYTVGFQFAVWITSENTQDWTYAVGLMGCKGQVHTESGMAATKTLTGAAAFYAGATFGSAANDMIVTNYYGLYISALSLVGNSKLANDYGIKVEDQEGGATLNYAIHTGAGLVHFGDDVDLAAGKTVDGIDIKTIQTRALMFAECS